MQQSELYKTSKMKLMAAADFLALGLDLDGGLAGETAGKKQNKIVLRGYMVHTH